MLPCNGGGYDAKVRLGLAARAHIGRQRIGTERHAIWRWLVPRRLLERRIPDGFTVLKDTMVLLRPRLETTVAPSVECPLSAKATYQQWNTDRVTAEALDFVSFTEIDGMVVKEAYEATLYAEVDSTETSVAFKPGDKWRYLAYYGEGAFLMQYDGVNYTGDQGLADASKSSHEGPRGYDEWLRINCANNKWGWLFMGDIKVDDVTFAGPNITEYGAAADLD
jgi:hypothetical protein